MMKQMIRPFTIASVLLLLSACVTNDTLMNTAQTFMNASATSQGNGGEALTTAQMTQGLKEALSVGTTQVVGKLGQRGGFDRDPAIRIPLPATLQKAHSTLSAIGMGGMTQDLENRMNEAAELAVPQAKELFLASIRQMTITDARTILFSGQQDAATQYLRKTMGQDLGTRIQPIVQNTLAKTGAVQSYDRMMGQYASLPYANTLKTNLNSYVTDKALDGVFYYVAKEEAAIRQNPAKRTSEILRTVFGAVQ